MYEFTPFKKTDKLSFESFIQFPRELLNREEYKVLSPNAMLLYSILTARLELSFKQIESNKKIQFYDAKGDMYVIIDVVIPSKLTKKQKDLFKELSETDGRDADRRDESGRTSDPGTSTSDPDRFFSA